LNTRNFAISGIEFEHMQRILFNEYRKRTISSLQQDGDDDEVCKYDELLDDDDFEVCKKIYDYYEYIIANGFCDVG
jgi:hypothetical protein